MSLMSIINVDSHYYDTIKFDLLICHSHRRHILMLEPQFGYSSCVSVVDNCSVAEYCTADCQVHY